MLHQSWRKCTSAGATIDVATKIVSGVRTMPLKCFVASAFDRPDVDEVFTKVLVPLLRKLGIRPLRVDRVEHNDDIDDKIFALLDESDFCIADLSYARPSVYYEAGYAAGKGKPVIYLARRDHFKAKQNDPNGNFRVHFDLQMKNIIPWSAAFGDLTMRVERKRQPEHRLS